MGLILDPNTTGVTLKTQRKNLKGLVAIAIIALLAFAGPPAKATTMSFVLNQFTGTGAPGPGPYGTVTLDDHGGPNVSVNLSLFPNFGLVNSGAGAALTWAMTGNPLLTITGLTPGFVVSYNGSDTGQLDGTGHWFNEIDCLTSLCGSGGSAPYMGAFNFTINGVQLGQFTQNPKGYYFGSDICTFVGANGVGCTGITGDIVATNATTSVREPASLLPFSLGVLGLGLIRRRKRA